jgi:2,4-dienoyl-CoA reductase-like NADH-dependent reductase (Old Yellow Enzyme family)
MLAPDLTLDFRMTARFPTLFSPLTIRGRTIRNRILSTGHQTWLAQGNLPGDDLIAYHAARAQGGAGLIVNEAARFHASTLGESPELVILSDDAIPHYARLAAAVHRHGARIFGQLSHSGRVTRRMTDGMRGVVYAPSPLPENRFHTVPREMPTEMVAEIIEAAAQGARRYAEAGYDGVELMASHGLLFAQFLNPAANRRDDIYGGSAENRLRPLRQALIGARKAIGEGVILGLRISADEDDIGGLDLRSVIEICRQLADEGLVDYINTTMGTMAALGGSIHVVPPMEIAPAYVAPRAAAIRAAVPVPVFVAGRINQPQIAESVLAAGQADMCGMTRALIADPDMPRKAREGRADEIRACIGCNQGCIGHFHSGARISCIQNPVDGRELRLAPVPAAPRPLRVVVAGGGPAGMKAAVTAAEMGHSVTAGRGRAATGGPGAAGAAAARPRRVRRADHQPAQRTGAAPGRGAAEHPRRSGLSARLGRPGGDPGHRLGAAAARGRGPRGPHGRGRAGADRRRHARRPRRGGRLALRLDRAGARDAAGPQRPSGAAGGERHLRRAEPATICARPSGPAGCIRPGCEVIPYARLFGLDATAAYFTHAASGEPIVLEGVDTVVSVAGQARRRRWSGSCKARACPSSRSAIAPWPAAPKRRSHDGLVVTRRFLSGLLPPHDQRPGNDLNPS